MRKGSLENLREDEAIKVNRVSLGGGFTLEMMVNSQGKLVEYYLLDHQGQIIEYVNMELEAKKEQYASMLALREKLSPQEYEKLKARIEPYVGMWS